ncbi:hypothetical protein [Chenggangzhangella methanolivorans]|uniref:Invasion associated locus B family protein n=1 Tax=Chenggangzhangella methanolivorans TaxID=1437009 RepID=A0A9E6UNT6_9HYPH|nr:hypothetical protein [Chenggangzhangella methanolivorans]QZO00604.1 hypothetical protein K6K41_02480 [Chenggangzhangella methanolivorans]
MRRVALAIAISAAVVPAWGETGQSGVWTYTYEPSSTGEGGIVTALAPAPSPSADPNDPSHLVARCLGGRVEFLVGGSGGWGLSRGQIEITTRVDDHSSETRRWDVSTNGKAAFLSEGVEAFLAALSDDGELRVMLADAAGARRETTFSTKGVAEVRAKIAKACPPGR